MHGVAGEGGLITAIDLWITQEMSTVAGHSPGFDWLLLRAFQTDLLKLFPLIVILLAWPGPRSRRESVVAGLLAAGLALALAAIAQYFGCDRVRPALDGLYHFPALPTDVQADAISFPSETAAMAFALAAAVMRRGRVKAWFACSWCVAVICLPRLYGGYHYASDLVAGAIIGILAYQIVVATSLPLWIAAAADRAGPKSLVVVQTLAIVYAFELIESFASLRVIASYP